MSNKVLRLPWPFEDSPDRLEGGWLYLHYGFDFPMSNMGGLPWCCFGPTPLEFQREGNRWWVSEAEDTWRLAGVLVQSDRDLPDLERSLAEADAPLTVWCNPESFRRLPRIRHRERVNSLVVWDNTSFSKPWGGEGLDDLSPVSHFPQLRSFYVRRCCCADLSPLQVQQHLEVLKLDAECNSVRLKPLCLLPQLSVLDLGIAFDSDLAPLRRLTTLRSLRLRVDMPAAEFHEILANNPRLERLEHAGCSQGDLLAIGKVKGLKALKLHGDFTDLSPLTGLKQLRLLDLYSGGPQDISPLAKMSELRYLSVSDSRNVQDLTPISSLEQLIQLRLPAAVPVNVLRQIVNGCPNLISFSLYDCNELTDLELFGQLSSLESLGLGGCDQLSDVSALKKLGKLKKLNLASCDKIVSYPEPGSLPSLTKLTLRNNCADLAWLSRSRELAVLDLTACPIQDLSPIAELPKLVAMKLSACRQLREILPLGQMPQLTIVELSNCRFRKLWSPHPASQLASLDLSSTPIQSLAPLTALGRLANLNLSGCKHIRDVKPLASLPNLWQLVLTGWDPKDRRLNAASLADSSSLRWLFLDGYGDEKLIDAEIQSLTGLTTLSLADANQIEDLRCLQQLTHLEWLSLASCIKVRDLSPLVKLPHLRYLDLTGCEGLKDFSALSRMPQLTGLVLEYTEVSDLSFLNYLPKLVTLNVHGCHDLHDVRPIKPLIKRGMRLTFDKRVADQLE